VIAIADDEFVVCMDPLAPWRVDATPDGDSDGEWKVILDVPGLDVMDIAYIAARATAAKCAASLGRAIFRAAAKAGPHTVWSSGEKWAVRPGWPK